MHVLIVLAQPEPNSFNGRLARLASDTLKSAGHSVEISDLYAQGFNPVEGPSHYTVRKDNDYFETQGEQRNAFNEGGVPADVAAELEKVRAADFIIFQFPVWWWGAPAMMKGWFDRCWTYGGMYTSRNRFENGFLKGKKAMLSVTLGASAEACEFNGNEGDTMLALWPYFISLRYVGLDVLPPLRLYGIHGGLNGAQSVALSETQSAAEDAMIRTLQDIDGLEPMPFNTADHFDEMHKLKPGAPSYTPFIRHSA